MGPRFLVWFKENSFLLSVVLATTVFTILVIYLTPLKHLNLVEPHIDDMAPQDFYALYQADPERYLFIDVRSEESYKRQHAKGSINMPLHTMYDQRHNFPKNGKEIILICSGGRASGVAYSYLEHFGFLNLTRIEGGDRELGSRRPAD